MKLNNTWRGLSFFLFASLMVFFTSCGGDDDPIIIDPGGGDVNVADGLYLAADGLDPSSSAALTAENVEDEGFASQARSGFVGGYIYMAAGSYTVVQVANKEITATIGGSATETVTDGGSSCDLNDYTVVTTSVGAAPFTVATSGLYRVTHDQTTSELVMYKIEFPELIGNATPGGWDLGTQLNGSVTADGGSWSTEGLILRSGQWKVRFNCRWNLDRRTDPNAGFGMDNGYQLFTNFGGTAADLQNGNDAPNIEQMEDGEYTITVNWDPRDGMSCDVNRTGDAPVITFNPNDFAFGAIGDATAGAWDTDRNFFHKFENDVHTWRGVVTFAATGEWKLRTNDSWDFNVGGDIAAPVANGDNMASPGEGAYYITISTADEGATWTGSLDALGWSIIGAGGPNGNWDDDVDMVSEGFDAGISTYTYTGDFAADQWKFRAGHDWALNLGGDLGFLNTDGDNIDLGTAGQYKITLNYDGEVYSATAEPQ